MDRTPDYRLVLRSDGDSLRLSVEGDRAAAGRQIREVRSAAAKLGIPVRLDEAAPFSPRRRAAAT